MRTSLEILGYSYVTATIATLSPRFLAFTLLTACLLAVGAFGAAGVLDDEP